MGSVRIYQKKQIRLDNLNFKQMEMFKLGTIGVASVRNRLAQAKGPEDANAKPLTKPWAIYKTKQGKGNRRNLMFTGDMLRNFGVRTVSDNTAKARVAGGRLNSMKAWINNKIEAWMVFSPKNVTEVKTSGQSILNGLKSRLTVERSLGGRQL